MTESRPDALKNLLDRLGIQVSIGQHHACIGKTLEDTLTTAQWHLAFEFWSFTLKAHFEAAVLGLTRLLDKDPDTVSLDRLSSLAESNAGQFDEMRADEVRRKVLPSIKNEVQELKKMVEPLKKRRDEMLAHNALQNTLTDRERNVAWAELETAYSRARALVNRIYRAYKGQNAIIIEGALQATVSEELGRILNTVKSPHALG